MFYVTILIITGVVVFIIAREVARTFRHVFCVPEGWAGLVYQHGLYVRRSNAGRHVIWGRGWTVNLVDLRKAFLPVNGQEVLTANNVSLKVCLLVTYQVADPVKAVHETQHWQNDLSYAAELALCTAANGITSEALPGQRAELGAQLLACVQPRAVKIGVSVLAIEVRDISRVTRENPLRIAWC